MRQQYLGVIAILLWTSVAWGDGCYIPEQAVRKLPKITDQYALLSWKAGVETLIISSALDSEAQKLGWIIPVPSVPETIEKATPGTLKTLDFCCLQPLITHDLWRELRATIVAVLLGNLLAAVSLFKPRQFGCVLALLLFLFFLRSFVIVPLGGTEAVPVAIKVPDVHAVKTANSRRLLRQYPAAFPTRWSGFLVGRERVCRLAENGCSHSRRLHLQRMELRGHQADAKRGWRQCASSNQAGIRKPRGRVPHEAHRDCRGNAEV